MGVPLKANQIRGHVNKKGDMNYYIVISTGHKESTFSIAWFRYDSDDPMYLVNNINQAKWVLEDDIVVVENMNLMRNALENSREPSVIETEVIDIFTNNLPGQRFIPAIKYYRDATNEGLKESKLAVEKLVRRHGLVE